MENQLLSKSPLTVQTAESLLNFAEESVQKLRGVQSGVVLEQLDQRYDELLSAIQWFIGQKRTDEGLRLVSSLVPFWMATKRLVEGSVWFDQVLAMPGGDDVYRGRALFDAGYLAFWRGEDERSSSLQHLALALGRQRDTPTIIALALVGLARIALRTDIAEARRLCREALTVTEGTADQAGRSSAMHVLAAAMQMAGDFLEARELMSQRIALAHESGNLATVSIESNNLSMVERQLGNFEEAEALVHEALDINYRRGDNMSIPWNLNGLAAVAAELGDFDRAAMFIGAADAAMEASGGAWPPDELAHYERTISVLRDELGSMAFARVRAVGHAMTTSEAVDFALGVRSAGRLRLPFEPEFE
ncbi:MAG TPA: tetratricopeptide repeat protein [Anaerolineales bacterium]|nr:tetratricopeptide repeat protein [Anaerolineales bacterium]